MNKIFKNVNSLGFAGMLIIGSIAFATSGFKSADSGKTELLTYGYDASHPEAPWVAEGTAGYSCVQSSDICKYNFENAPSNEPGAVTPRSEGTPIPDGNLGSYQQF